MVRMRFLITLMFIGILSMGVMAQQDAQYTQYMYNTLSVNPAYAGSRGQLSFAGLYRSQWVGLDGAPKTFTLNLHSPIRNSRLGYGVSVVNDNIGDGVVQQTYLDAAVSYTLEFARDAKLSFGLKAGGNMISLDFNGLRNFDQEVVNQNNIDNKFAPNFGLGIYYHTDTFYAGLSAPNVLETEYFDNSNSDNSNLRHII